MSTELRSRVVNQVDKQDRYSIRREKECLLLARRSSNGCMYVFHADAACAGVRFACDDRSGSLNLWR